jgi:hypothetical protein
VSPFGALCAAGTLAGGVVLSAAMADYRNTPLFAASASDRDDAPLRPPAEHTGRVHPSNAAASASLILFDGLQLPTSGQRLPSEPRKQFGASVTGAFEGWFYNDDGSRSFLVGYLNRNTTQELDVPVGPNNRIEPGGPDIGQPTHFLPGRNYGMFLVSVPKEFTPQDKYIWTVVANGQSTSIPLRLNNDYVISPFREIAVNNTPPVVRFDESGPAVQGPIAIAPRAPARAASMSVPLALSLWVSDDLKYTSGTNAPLSTPRPPVTLTWSKYRGPGTVTFDKPKPTVEKLSTGPAQGDEASFNGKATTRVTFSAPGEYLLHVTANDYSGAGGGGFVCCWTTAMVKVTVQP